MATSAPYGTWPSPIAVSMVRQQAVGFGMLVADGDDVLWTEHRPTEQGRAAVVRWRAGTTADAVPAGFDARARVHEYGGGELAAHRGVLIATRFDDQRAYRLDGGAPRAVTPQPEAEAGVRYADYAFVADRAVAVQEVHGEGEPVNRLVAFPVDGSSPPSPVVEGRDFFSSPRVSPDGRRLAWLTWDHPAMPWDGTELWVGALAADGSVTDAVRVAGGPSESVFQPEWSPNGVLHFVSDRTGWWNLYRWDGGTTQALHPAAEEHGAPQWELGMRRYAFVDRDRIACIADREGRRDLGILEAGEMRWLATGREVYANAIVVAGGRVVVIGGGPATPMSVLAVDPEDGTVDVIRSSSRAALSDMELAEFVSRPRHITFSSDGAEAAAHAYFYPPHHPGYDGPAQERPPLIVRVHGGPTGAVTVAFDLGIQFWTTRGFAVVDVNYRGSTGFGRSYREALKGEWGVADTADCIAAVEHLTERDLVDGQRVAIRGGSAGGYTTLCALAFHDVFSAGASYFGVADLALLAEQTHKFESHYLDGMVGPYPEASARYRERSPIHHTAGMRAPVLILQGLEDRVVPPAQAEAMVADLDARGIPHAYLPFAGEGHGFRRAETDEVARQAELAFYGEVFGFTPADDLPALPLVHRDRLSA